jgi:hypothetical protein
MNILPLQTHMCFSEKHILKYINKFKENKDAYFY